MPTSGFHILLFYDLYYSEGFQCLAAPSAVQAQRFSIVNGANFVGEAMSFISQVESLGRNEQVFLNTGASPHFSTRFEMAFGVPKLC